MPEIFLSNADLQTDILRITGEKARYLSAVLRCGVGDFIVLKDNAGNGYSAKIVRKAGRDLEVEIIAKLPEENETTPRITMLQGVLKGGKMDLVVQKVTELGVAEIIPVITERTQIRETRKVSRWRKIAEEASRQSGRITIPRVHDVVGIDQLDDMPAGILFWERGGAALASAIAHFGGRDEVALFAGPEGGFSAAEVLRMAERGFMTATLGRRILRAETAAIVAVSIIQYELGLKGEED